ncbi:hypothetical protein, partial [Vibrio ouci]
MEEALKPTTEQQDSLHILPLCMIPIKTPALRRACLVKNSRLETAVELFRDKAGHILPLCMIPIKTPALRRACLVKNSRLETAVELFRDKAGVSGQLNVQDLPDFFQESDADSLPDDMVKIRGLDKMPSFDVYSCRISLR